MQFATKLRVICAPSATQATKHHVNISFLICSQSRYGQPKLCADADFGLFYLSQTNHKTTQCRQNRSDNEHALTVPAALIPAPLHVLPHIGRHQFARLSLARRAEPILPSAAAEPILPQPPSIPSATGSGGAPRITSPRATWAAFC